MFLQFQTKFMYCLRLEKSDYKKCEIAKGYIYY